MCSARAIPPSAGMHVLMYGLSRVCAAHACKPRPTHIHVDVADLVHVRAVIHLAPLVLDPGLEMRLVAQEGRQFAHLRCFLDFHDQALQALGSELRQAKHREIANNCRTKKIQHGVERAE